MNIGRLDKRITFQQATVAKSASGQATTTWANIPSVPTVWAEVESQGGNENQEGQALQAAHQWRIRIRPRGDLTNKMRILYGSKTLYINSVGDPNRRTNLQELLASEGIPLNS